MPYTGTAKRCDGAFGAQRRSQTQTPVQRSVRLRGTVRESVPEKRRLPLRSSPRRSDTAGERHRNLTRRAVDGVECALFLTFRGQTRGRGGATVLDDCSRGACGDHHSLNHLFSVSSLFHLFHVIPVVTYDLATHLVLIDRVATLVLRWFERLSVFQQQFFNSSFQQQQIEG